MVVPTAAKAKLAGPAALTRMRASAASLGSGGESDRKLERRGRKEEEDTVKSKKA